MQNYIFLSKPLTRKKAIFKVKTLLSYSDIVGLLEQKNISILQTLHIAKYQANGDIKGFFVNATYHKTGERKNKAEQIFREDFEDIFN